MRIGLLTVWMLTVPALFAQGKPVPNESERAKADALIDEVYQDDIAKAAKDPSLKLRLAQIFLQEGRDTADHVAGRYRLFSRARDLAAAGGDAPTALQAIEELGAEFAIPTGQVMAMKIAALQEAARAEGSSAEAYRNVLQTAQAFVEDLQDQHDYASALEVLKAAEHAAKRLKSIALVATLRKRMAEAEENRNAFAPLQGHIERLRKAPDDVAANLELGKYFALAKGDWQRGLPHLAKVQGAVGDLARLDRSFPSSTQDQIALVDGWLKLAESNLGKESPEHCARRAYFWYLVASTEADAAEKGMLERKLAALKRLLPQLDAPTTIERELRVLEGHHGPVYAVAISPDGRKLVSGGGETALVLWDARAGKELRRLEGHGGRVWAVAFSPDGRRVASGSFDHSIRLWDLVSGRAVRQLSGHGDYVRSVAFSSDGKQLLSGGDDRLAKLWDLDSGQALQTFKGHDHFVWSTALSRDGKRALTGSLDRTARLWDTANGKELKRLEGHGDTVLAVAFSPSGRRAATGSTDRTIRIWDLAAGKSLRTLEGHAGYVNRVAFSPDGRFLLSAGQDKTVRVWDAATGMQVSQLDGHTDVVWDAIFAPDGRTALSAGQDKSIRVWGVK
jgi:hypothetical protein